MGGGGQSSSRNKGHSQTQGGGRSRSQDRGNSNNGGQSQGRRPSKSQSGGQSSGGQSSGGQSSGQCPGEELQACIDVCPGFSARVFGACVAGCAKRCPAKK